MRLGCWRASTGKPHMAPWLSFENAKKGRLLCPQFFLLAAFFALPECPLYPQKRTLELSDVMSALCQKQTYALQQNDRSLLGCHWLVRGRGF